MGRPFSSVKETVGKVSPFAPPPLQPIFTSLLATKGIHFLSYSSPASYRLSETTSHTPPPLLHTILERRFVIAHPCYLPSETDNQSSSFIPTPTEQLVILHPYIPNALER
jgi:hypothetical protein